MFYRFFPGIRWSEAYPKRGEILAQIHKVWTEYHLVERTRLSTKVTSIRRHEELSTDPREFGHARWVVNDGEDGVFDAVFAPVGSCGAPNMIKLRDQDMYKGRVVHSSDLDSLKDSDIKGRRVVVVGSGASAVEAVELVAARGCDNIKIVARDDKVSTVQCGEYALAQHAIQWIIPTNLVFDGIVSFLQPFGITTPLR